MKKVLGVVLIALIFSCKETNKTKDQVIDTVIPKTEEVVNGNSFTQSIEKAHNKEIFLNKNAVSYEVEVAFGGNTILEGTITQLTNGGKIRIDKKDGTKIIFDGNQAFLCPKDKQDPMARFHIFTWSYFFSFPYKLNDEGTKWGSVVNKNWGNMKFMYPTSKLTFAKGTGDAPDDWYVLYKNPNTDILEGSAYIVSFGKGVKEAEKEPHAIKFNDFITIENVPFATNWTFHLWNDSEGYGDQIGEVKLSNIKFLENTRALFNKPENSILIEAPAQ